MPTSQLHLNYIHHHITSVLFLFYRYCIHFLAYSTSFMLSILDIILLILKSRLKAYLCKLFRNLPTETNYYITLSATLNALTPTLIALSAARNALNSDMENALSMFTSIVSACLSLTLQTVYVRDSLLIMHVALSNVLTMCLSCVLILITVHYPACLKNTKLYQILNATQQLFSMEK